MGNSVRFSEDYKKGLLSESALRKLKNYDNKRQKLAINDHIKKKDKYKISIIIPTHNRLNELIELLNSIFAQSYTNYEIIIIDDVSTDETQAFFSDLNSKKIKYIRNQKNLGMGLNRQKGYKIATGDFVIFSDDDDYFVDDGYFKNAVEAFSDKKIDMICSHTYVHVENDDAYYPHILNIPQKIKALDYLERFQFELLKPTSSFPLIVRKKILEKAHFERMKMMNDSSIYLRSLMVARNVFRNNRIIGVYRVHNGNDTLNVKAGFTIKNLQEKRYVYNYLKRRHVDFDLTDWYEKQVAITVRHFLNGGEKSKLKRMWVLLYVLKNVSYKLFKELYISERKRH